MLDPLTELCRLAVRRDLEIGVDEVVGLPSVALANWTAAGLLEEIEPLGSMYCPVCAPSYERRLHEMQEWGYAEDPPTDWCWADVRLARDAGDDIVRMVARCPKSGKELVVPPASVPRWRISLLRVADLLSRTGGFGGGATEVVAGRLYHVGRTPDDAAWRQVYLARGLAWAGDEDVLRRAAMESGGYDRVVVVTVEDVATGDIATAGPRFLALRDLLAWDGTAFVSTGNATPGATTAPVGPPPSDAPSLRPTSPSSPSTRYEVRPILVPPKTRWSDVRLWIGTRELCVDVGSVREWRRFDETGFANRQHGAHEPEPNLLWHLLQKFAVSGFETAVGRVHYEPPKAGEDLEVARKRYNSLKTSISRLREVLQALIPGVEGDGPGGPISPIVAPRRPRSKGPGHSHSPSTTNAPLPNRRVRGPLPHTDGGEPAALDRDAPHDDQADRPPTGPSTEESDERGYKAEFVISPLLSSYLRTLPGTTWANVSMAREDQGLVVRVVDPPSGAGTAAQAGRQVPDGPVTQVPVVEETIDLDTLPLDRDSRAALNELLSTGVISREERDRAPYNLRRALGAMLLMDGLGITFRRPSGPWVPHFVIKPSPAPER